MSYNPNNFLNIFSEHGTTICSHQLLSLQYLGIMACLTPTVSIKGKYFHKQKVLHGYIFIYAQFSFRIIQRIKPKFFQV